MVQEVSAIGAGASELLQARRLSKQLGRDEFMRLLIANLQNQDPLNPLQGADFSAQLAQFSALEELTQINQKLDGALTPGVSGQLPAVSLIGKEVTVASNNVTVQGGKASELTYHLAGQALVTLKVKSASGALVADLVMGTQSPGDHELRLDQIDAVPPLADGSYTVELTQTSEDGTSKSVVTRTSGRVSGVSLQDPPLLFLANGSTVRLDELLEVRERSENL